MSPYRARRPPFGARTARPCAEGEARPLFDVNPCLWRYLTAGETLTPLAPEAAVQRHALTLERYKIELQRGWAADLARMAWRTAWAMRAAQPAGVAAPRKRGLSS